MVDTLDLFISSENYRIRSDEEILAVLREGCHPNYDLVQETRKSVYKWSLRDLTIYPSINGGRQFITVVLARSVLEKEGLIVTDKGITQGASSARPPLASAITVFFDLARHLVAVEHSGELSQTAWRDYLTKILANAALNLGKVSVLEFEPVPEKHEIISLFMSFERITRIKATLRIPNPELTRYTKLLFEDLRKSGVREYTQDMKNPNGLSKEKDARPFSTVALAQQGYKAGDVQFEGIRDGEYQKVLSGSVAARGSISSLKDFVRGMHANAKAKETKRVLSEIAKEIDRIHPPEAKNDS